MATKRKRSKEGNDADMAELRCYSKGDVGDLEDLIFKSNDGEKVLRELLDKLHTDKEPIYDEKQTMFLNNVIRCPGLPDCTLANVVSTYNLGVLFNLRKMAYFLKPTLQCQFNPLNFAAMSLTIRTKWLPPTTVLIFSSSNTVHTGSRSEDHARQSAWALVYYLNKHLGIPATLHDFQIRNLVSNFRAGFKVDLAKLAADLGSRATFTPNKIHSCRIRCIRNPKRVCLMYPSGSGVLTGTKTRDEIIEWYKESWKNCARFKCEGVTSRNEYRYSTKGKNFSNRTLEEVNVRLSQIDPSVGKQHTTPATQINEEQLTKMTGIKFSP
jgi:TATA-box binding protein (TBP) (component of TFIID and TFIIIB)